MTSDNQKIEIRIYTGTVASGAGEIVTSYSSLLYVPCAMDAFGLKWYEGFAKHVCPIRVIKPDDIHKTCDCQKWCDLTCPHWGNVYKHEHVYDKHILIVDRLLDILV